jgi:MFS family permease
MRLLRLFPIYLVVFVGFVGYSMMIAIFTPMFLHGYGRLMSADASAGVKTTILGFVLCLYPLGQFLSAPPIGALSDRYGRRPVLMISLGLSICCYALIAAAITIENLWLLMIALLAAGLSEGNIVITQSAVADVSEAKDRARLFGYIYMSASLAYVFGPLAGGKLASPTVVPWFSYMTPFWAMLLPLLVTLGAVALFFRETHQVGTGVAVNLAAALQNLHTVFQPGRIRMLYFVNFAFYLGIFGFFRCYPMYIVDEFHLDVSSVSELIAWLAVPIIIGSLWLAGILTSRFPIVRVTIWSGLLTALTMALIVIPASPAALWVTLFLTGLPLSICMASCPAMLSVSVSAQQQGSVLGNNQAIQVLAESVSGVIGGLIAALVVKASLLAMAAFVCGGVVLLLLSVSKRPVQEAGTA